MSPYDDIELAPHRLVGAPVRRSRYRSAACRRGAVADRPHLVVVILITWITLLGIGAGLVSWLCVHG